MATFTNTSKSSTTWSNDAKTDNAVEGSPIGLLLVLTSSGFANTTWTNVTKS